MAHKIIFDRRKLKPDLPKELRCALERSLCLLFWYTPFEASVFAPNDEYWLFMRTCGKRPHRRRKQLSRTQKNNRSRRP